MSDAIPEVRDTALANLVAGTLIGLAAGDALGAGYELAVPPRQGEAAMIGGGLGNWEPGEWTDDTQLAVCIAPRAISILRLSGRSSWPGTGRDRPTSASRPGRCCPGHARRRICLAGLLPTTGLTRTARRATAA